jgi:hypothetical protein
MENAMTTLSTQQPAPPPRSYYTLRQIAIRHPAFSVRTLRHWIANAHDRPAWKNRKRVAIPGNGFARVMLKVGKRIYIDEVALLDWLEQSRR